LPAGEAERAVIDKLRGIFRSPELIGGTFKAALTTLDDLWDELFPDEQARIVTLLVERVIVYSGSLDLYIRADGMESLVKELRGKEKKGADHANGKRTGT
jgi:hypothetical protein